MNKDKLINNGIKGDRVFLVGAVEKEEVYKNKAVEVAQSYGLDLVQVGTDKDGVAVCKMLDYSKYLYTQKKNKKSNVSKSPTMKEIRITIWIAENDMRVKANNINRLLKEGHKVKLMLALPKRVQPSEDKVKGKMYKIVNYIDTEIETKYIIDGFRREVIIENKVR